jgi:hypothetical protein
MQHWQNHISPMDGPSPSTSEIKPNCKTVYYRVMKLIIEGRRRQERVDRAIRVADPTAVRCLSSVTVLRGSRRYCAPAACYASFRR